MPGPERRRPFKGDAALSPGRLPSASISILRPSEALRRSCYGPFETPRTLSPGAAVPPFVGGGRLLRGYPRSPRVASRLPSMPWTRCFSPTSAIDSRHEHPWTARLPGARLAPHRPQGASPTEVGFARAAPDRLSAIQPRLRARLTACRFSFGSLVHDETRDVSSRSAPRRGPRSRSHPARALSVRTELPSSL